MDFINVFSKDLTVKVAKQIKINYYATKLVNGQQHFYNLIYSLKSVELKTLKTYIKTYLANDFIRLSKPFAKALFLLSKSPIVVSNYMSIIEVLHTCLLRMSIFCF